MRRVSQRLALMAVPPVRSYWTTARPRAAGGRSRAAAAAQPSRRQYEASFLGPLAAGGQRRFLSEEKERKEEKQEPRAGVGVFATFMKSIRDQMGQRAQTDEELAAAQERLEQARLESIEKAEAAMKRAQEAAQEASRTQPRAWMRVFWPCVWVSALPVLPPSYCTRALRHALPLV
jgi:hypothetical protein